MIDTRLIYHFEQQYNIYRKTPKAAGLLVPDKGNFKLVDLHSHWSREPPEFQLSTGLCRRYVY
jgi:hypothetical protein